MSKTIIISGASRGLGRAAALIAAEHGANVVINARSEAALKAAADQITTAGGQVAIAAGDVSQQETASRMVEAALDAFGGIDAVINNAGVLEPIQSINEADPDAWQTSWAINVLGPVLLVKAALPHLRQSKGRVINVSSGAAVRAIAGWGAYCASKAAINMFTEMLAVEEPDLTSIAVRPGVVDTAMQVAIRETGQAAMEPDTHANFVTLHEEGGLLPPEKPGRALVALALHADPAWRGEFINWDDERVQGLVEEMGDH